MPPNGGKEPDAKLSEETDTCHMMVWEIICSVPRRKTIQLDKRPPGTFAKLEGLRKNENAEKAKRQTEILGTVHTISVIILGLVRISSQHSRPSQLLTNFHTSEKLFISSEWLAESKILNFFFMLWTKAPNINPLSTQSLNIAKN